MHCAYNVCLTNVINFTSRCKIESTDLHFTSTATSSLLLSISLPGSFQNVSARIRICPSASCRSNSLKTPCCDQINDLISTDMASLTSDTWSPPGGATEAGAPWSNFHETTIYMAKLSLLCNSQRELNRVGYVTRPLTEDQIDKKVRCRNCNGM
jgi:hypothetical protein